MNYPRVSTILSDLGIRSAGTAFMEPKHRRRGRLVHEACHILGKGMEIDPAWFERSSGEGDHDLVAHKDCIPYIDGYRKFMRDAATTTEWQMSNFFPIRNSELEVTHKLERYVGHIDQIGKDEQVLDIKTGSSPPWTKLQTALYDMAYAAGNRRWELTLPGDGDYKLARHADYRDFAAGTVLVRAWWLINSYGGHE